MNKKKDIILYIHKY